MIKPVVDVDYVAGSMTRRFLKHFAFTLTLMLVVYSTVAQNQTVYHGRITDSSTLLPLTASSIFVKNTSYGTISNSNGEFSINVPASDSVQLEISHMGYETRTIQLTAVADGQRLQILLSRKVEQLQEVIVERRNALAIIQRALKSVAVNYINDPHTTTGFYRMDMRKGEEFIELSEAVFDVYNFGYSNKKESLLRLQKMRSAQDEQLTKDLSIGVTPDNIFEYDIVKNANNHEILSQKNLRKYRFDVEGIKDVGGRQAYTISFDQKDGLRESLFTGYMYVDTASYAFIGFDYQLSAKGLPYFKFGSGSQRMLMKIMDLHIGKKASRFQIQYRNTGNRWALSSVNTSETFSFKSDRRKYDFDADLTLKYVVTHIDTASNHAFSKAETLDRKSVIEFQETGPYGEFWKNYNTILPDYKTEDVALSIQAKNNRHRLKTECEKMLGKMKSNLTVRLDSLVSFYYGRGQFNGSVLVSEGSKNILHKSYGYSDIEKQIAADSNTRYRIGSLSKSFTAVIISQLAAEDKLSLSAPLKTYLPWYKNGNVTIDQLLTHQSGIPNLTTNDQYLTEIINKEFTLKELVERFCSDSLEFESGTKFKYSNSGYAILALVAETVAGKSFESLLRERIFVPLEMNDTHLAQTTGLATGYYHNQPEPLYHLDNAIGYGGIVSTTSDLKKYGLALNSSKLLPAPKLSELFKRRAEYKDWEADYGYGWMIDRNLFAASKKNTIIYHPGTDFGFHSMFLMVNNVQIILLNNTGEFPRFDIVDLMLNEIRLPD